MRVTAFNHSSDYEVNVGLAICTGVNTMGRKSYNGFNPDIEVRMHDNTGNGFLYAIVQNDSRAVTYCRIWLRI